MCENGTTREELMGAIEMAIITTGYAVRGVEADDDSGGWVYTIGLSESHGLPELVMTDADPAEAASAIDWIVEQLLHGLSINDFDPNQIVFGSVDQAHANGDLLNLWREYYGREPDVDNTLQVRLGSDLSCTTCAQDRIDLSDPNADLSFKPRLNRAQRRALARSEGRARRKKLGE